MWHLHSDWKVCPSSKGNAGGRNFSSGMQSEIHVAVTFFQILVCLIILSYKISISKCQNVKVSDYETVVLFRIVLQNIYVNYFCLGALYTKENKEVDTIRFEVTHSQKIICRISKIRRYVNFICCNLTTNRSRRWY